MTQSVDDLLAEFDDLTDDVSRSKHAFFAANLRRWFAFMDGTPEVASAITKFENSIDYEQWSKDGLKPQSGMGPGRISLPEDTEPRLGVLIGLFRSLTAREDAALKFSHSYVSSERNFNDNIADLVNQVFAPFAKDLRRQISRALTNSVMAPAADRIVPINHNEIPYKELLEALDKVKATLQGTNDYDDPEDKEQRIAELLAGRLLLEPTRGRLTAILATLGDVLRYLAKRFVDTAIGRIATLAIEKLVALIPTALAFFLGP